MCRPYGAQAFIKTPTQGFRPGLTSVSPYGLESRRLNPDAHHASSLRRRERLCAVPWLVKNKSLPMTQTPEGTRVLFPRYPPFNHTNSRNTGAGWGSGETGPSSFRARGARVVPDFVQHPSPADRKAGPLRLRSGQALGSSLRSSLAMTILTNKCPLTNKPPRPGQRICWYAGPGRLI